MADVAVRAVELGKRYRIGERQPYQTVRDVIAASARSRLSRRSRDAAGARPPTDTEWVWALEDVSFELAEGEALGIIGRNGAGKSTLLKILSRITEPTRGHADISGRVGALLEVGTGFHPELTGRENITLNGAILGMRRAEIDRKFDDIVTFAGVERFIDTPVKRYSTGMHARLAFAVAAHLEPDILIVDEVLAVGDAEFQRRCMGKMGQAARSGRTVLFVSHNMAAIESLCSRAIWLEAGRCAADGAPRRHLRLPGDVALGAQRPLLARSRPRSRQRPCAAAACSSAARAGRPGGSDLRHDAISDRVRAVTHSSRSAASSDQSEQQKSG